MRGQVLRQRIAFGPDVIASPIQIPAISASFNVICCLFRTKCKAPNIEMGCTLPPPSSGPLGRHEIKRQEKTVRHAISSLDKRRAILYPTLTTPKLQRASNVRTTIIIIFGSEMPMPLARKHYVVQAHEEKTMAARSWEAPWFQGSQLL